MLYIFIGINFEDLTEITNENLAAGETKFVEKQHGLDIWM